MRYIAPTIVAALWAVIGLANIPPSLGAALYIIVSSVIAGVLGLIFHSWCLR